MVMRSDRCSRTQYLFTQNLSLSTLRQSRIKLDNAESKSLRSLLQILTAFHIHPSSLRPHPFVHGCVISSGLTYWSNCSPVRSPSSMADSRRDMPFLWAFLAILAALS